MKKQLLLLKNRILLLCLMFMSFGLFGQQTLIEYNFNDASTWNTPNDLDAGVIPVPVPTLKYWRPSGGTRTELTPNFQAGRLVAFQQDDYVELTINTTGYSSLNLSFDLTLLGQGVVAGGSWNVSYNTGSGWIDNGGVNGTTWFLDQTDVRSYNRALPGDFSAVNLLMIRISAANWNLWGSTSLQLDNLKITYGNPNITLFSDSNVIIPDLAEANEYYNTVYGNLQTLLTPGESRTYRIRNFNGINGSILNVSSIQIEPAAGTTADDFVVTASNNITGLGRVTSPNSSTFGAFTVRFIPQAEGVRSATVKVYSNGAPNPYSFTVIGGGRSCNVANTPYVHNTMDPSMTQTLPSNLQVGDFVGGTSAVPAPNLFGTNPSTIYPNQTNGFPLYTSANYSWYTKEVEKVREFGGVDISQLRNVSVEFNVAAFSRTNSTGSGTTGVGNGDYIKLSVNINGTWYDVMRLNGSDDSRNNQRRKYAFNATGRVFERTYSNGLDISVANTGINTASNGNAYARFKLKLPLPVSMHLTDFKFRIAAKANGDAAWLIDDVRITSDNAIYKTWNGSAWSPAGRPSANEKAVFAGNYDFTAGGNTADLSICACEVNANALLTIPAAKTLTVRGDIVNTGDGGNIVVQTGGNLIQIEDGAVNTGSITAERTVSNINNLSTHMDYMYWSAPVTGQGLQVFSPGTPANRIYQYNEPNDLFKAVNLSTEPNFVPGKGYAFRAEGAPLANNYTKTYKFKGVPNNGLVEREVQRSSNTGAAADIVHGYNLIGNPYPSNMSFEQFYQMNKDVIYNTAWFWTNNFFTPNQQGSGYGMNNYAVWNGTGGVAATAAASNNPNTTTDNITVPNGIVTVGQGFIVQVKNLGPGQKVQFRNRNGSTPLRVSSAGTFYSRQHEEKDRFWLKLISADSIVNSQLIGYIDGASNGYEQDYDAELMAMSSDVFYSLLEDRKLQIQGKGAFDQSDKVQLGANIFKNGTYTIAIENPQGIFNAGQKVYLKDNLLNRWVDLNAQAYSFEATKGITEGRFEIVYESPTILGTDAVTKDELMVYRDSGDFVVKAKSKKMTSLEVYDGSGRLVYTAKPNDTKVVISGDRLNRGVYILKINQDGIVTGKKILK